MDDTRAAAVRSLGVRWDRGLGPQALVVAALACACGTGATFGTGSGPSIASGDSLTSGDEGDDDADGPGASETGAGTVGAASGMADSTAGNGDDVDSTAANDGSSGMGGSEDGGASSGPGESSGGGESSDDGSTGSATPSLNQAAYNPATGAYQFGFESTPTIPLTNAPGDVDWTRWAMLHDGTDYRLYFMRAGTDETLYQFAYNQATDAYEYAYMSNAVIPIVGAPADADMGSFAMLHDGQHYRLYVLSVSLPLRLHQFAYDTADDQYEYGYMSTPQIDVTGTPAGADWSGWGMLEDANNFRLYVFSGAAHDRVAQHGYNAAAGDYQYGFASTPQIDVDLIPADSNTDDFAMLHDGDNFRFYFLTTP